MPEARCPICENKLNRKHLEDPQIDEISGSNFVYHFCKQGINHFYSSLSQENQIQNMVITLNHNITVRVNYQKGTSIIFIQDGFTTIQTLEIPKILPTDFPKLDKLKEIIHLYMTFL